MADLFEESPESSEDAFALPGDEELLANTTAGQELVEEQAAEETSPVTEAARLLRSQRDKAEDSAEEEIPESGTPEDAEPSDVEVVAEADDPVQALLAKYGGDERKALEAALEAQQVIGRQAQELGQARQAVEEWQAWAQQQQQQAAQPQGTEGWEDLIDEDPAYATQLAYQQGNNAAYQAAARAWQEVSPGAPQNWYDNQQIKSAIATSTQQMEQTRREQAGMNAVNQVVTRYPDLPDMVDRMVEIAPQYPHELMALASGNMDIAAPAIESLYLKARGLTSDTLAQTAQQLARKQTEEEMRVRQEAGVATATRTNAEPPASLAESIAAEWPNDDSLSEGWNVGKAAS